MMTTLVTTHNTDIHTGMTVMVNGNVDRVISVNAGAVVLSNGYALAWDCQIISVHTVEEGDTMLVTNGNEQHAVTVQSPADANGWFQAYVWSVGVMQVHLSQIYVK